MLLVFILSIPKEYIFPAQIKDVVDKVQDELFFFIFIEGITAVQRKKSDNQ